MVVLDLIADRPSDPGGGRGSPVHSAAPRGARRTAGGPPFWGDIVG